VRLCRVEVQFSHGLWAHCSRSFRVFHGRSAPSTPSIHKGNGKR
jgi:hypothetical protein